MSMHMITDRNMEMLQRSTSQCNTRTVSDVSSSSGSSSDHTEETATKHSFNSENQLLRMGKWSTEEYEYSSLMIQYYQVGLLALPDELPLRAYIAQKLRCHPTRVTKKYPGVVCLGTRRFYDSSKRPEVTAADREIADSNLRQVQTRFLNSLEQENIPDAPKRKLSSHSDEKPKRLHLDSNKLHIYDSNRSVAHIQISKEAEVKACLESEIEQGSPVFQSKFIAPPNDTNYSSRVQRDQSTNANSSNEDNQNLNALLSSLALLTQSAEYLGPAFAELIRIAQISEQQKNDTDENKRKQIQEQLLKQQQEEFQQKQMQERILLQQQEALCDILSKSIMIHLKNQVESHATQCVEDKQKEIERIVEHVEPVALQESHENIKSAVGIDDPITDIDQIAKEFEAKLKNVYKEHISSRPQHIKSESKISSPDCDKSNGKKVCDILESREPDSVLSSEAPLPKIIQCTIQPSFRNKVDQNRLSQMHLMELRKNFEDAKEKADLLEKQEMEKEREMEEEKLKQESELTHDRPCVENENTDRLLYLASVASLAEPDTSPRNNPVDSVQHRNEYHNDESVEEWRSHDTSYNADSSNISPRHHCISSSSDDSCEQTTSEIMTNKKRIMKSSGKGPIRKRSLR